MGTWNHLLRLGETIYLEIVALDPDGSKPGFARWFGLDDQDAVRTAWDAGLRLRGWVARTDDIDAVLAGRDGVLGHKVELGPKGASFFFAIPADGSLPLGEAAPSVIDRKGKARSMAGMADLGARLQSLTLEHPDPTHIAALYPELGIADPPTVIAGPCLRYRARIETTAGPRELT